MLHEYAVEPEAIGQSYQDARFLLGLFGVDRGFPRFDDTTAGRCDRAWAFPDSRDRTRRLGSGV